MAQVPYEFLVRWNHLTGSYQGSHVKLYDNVTMREGDAQAVSIAGSIGFPLADILTSIQTGAIIAADDAIAAKNMADQALINEQNAHSETQLKLSEAIALINSLTKI